MVNLTVEAGNHVLYIAHNDVIPLAAILGHCSNAHNFLVQIVAAAILNTGHDLKKAVFLPQPQTEEGG